MLLRREKAELQGYTSCGRAYKNQSQGIGTRGKREDSDRVLPELV
jgi:hypothetical protein